MRHKNIVLVVSLLVTMMMTNSCQNGSAPAVDLRAPDTLIAMVEREIAQKKVDQEAVDKFRRRNLPRNFDNKMEEYYPVIRKYSKRYGLDWRLITAQILKESYFKENARSHVGARGLMQIMPRTEREIQGELDYLYISKDPKENITAGIYYLYKQIQYFREADIENRLKLALAAYNCGPARVFDARDIARFKQLNPNTWEAVKACLPLLTPESWKLHLEVWPKGTPNFGYFYGFEETTDYVDDIFEKYSVLKMMY